MKFATSKHILEFTVEKRETVSIRRTRSIASIWCEACGCETRMSNPEDAADILQIGKRAIYAGIEGGETHFRESDDGSLMVCHRSIEQHRRSRRED